MLGGHGGYHSAGGYQALQDYCVFQTRLMCAQYAWKLEEQRCDLFKEATDDTMSPKMVRRSEDQGDVDSLSFQKHEDALDGMM